MYVRAFSHLADKINIFICFNCTNISFPPGYKMIISLVLLLCCPSTPMALASGGSPMFPLVVHQPASPSIWPRQQCSHSGGVCPQIQGRQYGAYVGAVEEMMCVVCVDVTEGA